MGKTSLWLFLQKNTFMVTRSYSIVKRYPNYCISVMFKMTSRKCLWEFSHSWKHIFCRVEQSTSLATKDSKWFHPYFFGCLFNVSSSLPTSITKALDLQWPCLTGTVWCDMNWAFFCWFYRGRKYEHRSHSTYFLLCALEVCSSFNRYGLYRFMCLNAWPIEWQY